ncbi:MAG: homocysteine S-methyltransferase family protein [Actinomycetia bacterium]|nr:homocysteine S-methyltransferase family protein [Actinomycetes bacterium]
MNDLRADLGVNVLVFEGAKGTMVQRGGFVDIMPEQLNLIEPEFVTQIHRDYVLAGADVCSANSFGASRPKLAEFGLEDSLEVINRQAIKLSRAAGPRYVLGDIGPSGLVMEPLGKASFDELFAVFAEQASALASADPDGFMLATFTDIAEARCALLACKEVALELPVIASVALGENGRMELSGTDAACAAVILEAAGADAVSLNCSLGPDEMLPFLRQMIAATRLPVAAYPNAGIPRLDEQGATVYPSTPEDYGRFAAAAVDAGAAMVGGCCGATAPYIGAIADEISGRAVRSVEGRGFDGLVVAGPRKVTVIGGNQGDRHRGPWNQGDRHRGPLRMIGERINPTGKRELRETLAAGNFSVARDYAAAQAEAGADLLDVNVGAPGIDAPTILPRLVLALSAGCDVPLCIDTTDPAALEAALRVYPGKALINSVNGEAASMEAVLPLAKRYGAALVVLALDENGIPATPEARLKVVRKVLERAAELGIAPENLLVDSLVMAAAADASAPTTTLDAARAVRADLGLATMLGVSNVSHGLPERPALNAAFLAAAAAEGLDVGIVNPNDTVIHDTVATINAARAAGTPPDGAAARAELQTLLQRALDPNYGEQGDSTPGPLSHSSGDSTPGPLSPEAQLARAIMRGDSDGAPQLTDALVAQGWTPERLITDILTPAIQELGEGFGRGDVFLPQLMVAADAMKAATARAKTYLSAAQQEAAIRGRVVFATVKGDIHSIGKDICISLLESQGFVCDDLGVDVPTSRILDAARNADVVCLSALMTTTMPAMEAAAHAVTEELGLPVLVGGAVVTGGWAASIGAGYGANATACVTAVEHVLGLFTDSSVGEGAQATGRLTPSPPSCKLVGKEGSGAAAGGSPGDTPQPSGGCATAVSKERGEDSPGDPSAAAPGHSKDPA